MGIHYSDHIIRLVKAARAAHDDATDVDSGTCKDSDHGTHWACCHQDVVYWPRQSSPHSDTCWTIELGNALKQFKDVS